MKLSKAQLKYIEQHRNEMAARKKDIMSLGDLVWDSQDLSAELTRMNFQRAFYNHMINLHNVEVKAEKETQLALETEVEKELSK